MGDIKKVIVGTISGVALAVGTGNPAVAYVKNQIANDTTTESVIQARKDAKPGQKITMRSDRSIKQVQKTTASRPVKIQKNAKPGQTTSMFSSKTGQ
jgi:hypothetical protein